DDETIATRCDQRLCETDLQITSPGTHADEAAFARSGVVASRQMPEEEVIRARYADRFELGSQIAIGPIVENRRQVVHGLAARKEQPLHPRAPAIVDARRAAHRAADAAQQVVAVAPQQAGSGHGFGHPRGWWRACTCLRRSRATLVSMVV